MSSVSTVRSEHRTIVRDVIRLKKTTHSHIIFTEQFPGQRNLPRVLKTRPLFTTQPKVDRPQAFKTPSCSPQLTCPQSPNSIKFPMQIQPPKRNSSHALSTTIYLTSIHKRQATPTHPKPSQPIIQIVLILHYSPHPIQYEKTTQTIFIRKDPPHRPSTMRRRQRFKIPQNPSKKGKRQKGDIISPPKTKSQACPSLERALEGGGIILNSPRNVNGKK